MKDASTSHTLRRTCLVALVLIVAAATLGRSNIAAAQDECFGSTPDILGTPGDDIITATNGGENISGLGGNDLIQSSGGANNICGGDGADTIIFSGGADNVAGGDGNDTLTGTSDYNGVYGGPGDDTIDVTGVGNYYGDAGDDTIDATSNNSNIYGGPDNDAIDVTGNGDAIHGEFDNDSVNVEGDADSIDGGPGDDDLHAIGDYDSIDGNDGYDTCTVSGAGNSMTACESFYGDLAAHWAPVIYQDTDSTCAVADYVTNFDYDGDWQGIDNWEHLATDTTNSFFGTTSCQALRSTPSYVYYWVVETANDWYIGYALFHPRDWSDGTCLQAAGNANCHENDMEGVLLTVQKDGSPYGQLLLMNTVLHSDYPAYRASQNVTGDFDGDVSFSADGHPLIFVETQGHGITGTCPWFECTFVNGAGWPFPGDDGVAYQYAGVPAVPTSGNDRNVGYALQDIQDLWFRACETGQTLEVPFASFGTFRGDNWGENSANAPWGWGSSNHPFLDDPVRGDFFLHPSTAISLRYPALVQPSGFVAASFSPAPGETTGDCVPQAAGNGVSAAFHHVTTPGTTATTTSTFGSPPPAGYRSSTPATYYDVSTTVTFSGNVDVCINYEEAAFGLEGGIRLFHDENGSWNDVTTVLDQAENNVCGVVSSLSPFTVAELVPDEDYDADGCTNAQELGFELTDGGLRDPLNPNDYFNPSHDGQNRIDDILLVVHEYFIDGGNPNYNENTDRTLLGPNAWNLGAPNGQQRIDDILNILHQYYHDCS